MKTTYVLKIAYNRKVFVNTETGELPNFVLEDPGQGKEQMDAVLSKLGEIGIVTSNHYAFQIRKIKKGLKEITVAGGGFPSSPNNGVNVTSSFFVNHSQITITEFLKNSENGQVKQLFKGE